MSTSTGHMWNSPDRQTACRLLTQRSATILLLSTCGFMFGQGCSAVTYPISGIPVYRVPDEFLAVPEDQKQTINLAHLRQNRKGPYRLDYGDVLGVWVEGIMGQAGMLPPVQQNLAPETRGFPPSVGLPFPVLENGSVDLPSVGLVKVRCMTIDEAKRAVQRAYIEQMVLTEGWETIIVSLSKPRLNRVLVIRQESGTSPTGSQGSLVTGEVNRFKRGTAFAMDLPAYQNDVLTALTNSGGLPGIDAINEIRIQRGGFTTDTERDQIVHTYNTDGQFDYAPTTQVVIPLRMYPGTPLPFSPADVVLNDGDVIFIEALESNVYYTAGLLPAGQFPLPRDYSLDVIEAISAAKGPMFSGGLLVQGSAFNNSTTQGGIGSPNPSQAMVLRTLADGRQLQIRVDLNRALTDPRERVILIPNDVVILQQTPEEALSNYITDTIAFQGIFRLFSRSDATGTANLVLP